MEKRASLKRGTAAKIEEEEKGPQINEFDELEVKFSKQSGQPHKKRKYEELEFEELPMIISHPQLAQRLKTTADAEKYASLPADHTITLKIPTYYSTLLVVSFGSVAKVKHIPIKEEVKIASFDMDGTLIKTKSGGTFAKSYTDWMMWHDSVKPKLQQLDKEGYRIIVFTNQGGVEAGKVRADQLEKKFSLIQAHIGVPMIFLAAMASDQYRKPSLGMWDHFTKDVFTDIKINMKDSFYCGDAAGRPKTATRPKDFTDTDLKFAINIGLPFKTPEQLFLGESGKSVQKIESFFKKASGTDQKANNSEEVKEPSKKKTETYTKKEQELVLFFGPPGSGKSTFWSNHLPGYERISQDKLGSADKCMKVCREVLTSGKSAVIDNTNKTIEQRSRYTNIAKELKVQTRIFMFDTDKEKCMHNNKQRATNPHREHFSKKVGTVVIHDFFKNKEMPSEKEGFTEIKHVAFSAGPYANDDDEKTYNLLS